MELLFIKYCLGLSSCKLLLAKDTQRMHNSKLIAFFKTFTRADFKAFLSFVQSPYFNNNKKVIDLYRYIRSAAPRFTASRLGKHQTFAHLYPNQKFKEIKLQQLMSELIKVIEKFWIQQAFNENELSKDMALIKKYRQKIKLRIYFINKFYR